MAVALFAVPAVAAAAVYTKASAPFKGSTEVGGKVTVKIARENGIRVVETVSFRRFTATCDRGHKKFRFKITGRATVVDSARRFELTAGDTSSSVTVRGRFKPGFKKVRGTFRFGGTANGKSCATGKRTWHAKR